MMLTGSFTDVPSLMLAPTLRLRRKPHSELLHFVAAREPAATRAQSAPPGWPGPRVIDDDMLAQCAWRYALDFRMAIEASPVPPTCLMDPMRKCAGRFLMSPPAGPRVQRPVMRAN